MYICQIDSRGFSNVFSKMETGFHLFEPNFFEKNVAPDVQTRWEKSSSVALWPLMKPLGVAKIE